MPLMCPSIYLPVTAPATNVNTDVLAAAVLHINTTDVCRCVLCSEYLCVWLNKCNIIIQMANINFEMPLCASLHLLITSAYVDLIAANELTQTLVGLPQRPTLLNTNDCPSAPAAIKDSQLGGEERMVPAAYLQQQAIVIPNCMYPSLLLQIALCCM